ncbi:MAG TPA: hypothetical protein ENI85_09125 [Deltaproteobacteria bacterium]|nr:hypothetical protein [Deltaproteobacteria bacterium]
MASSEPSIVDESDPQQTRGSAAAVAPDPEGGAGVDSGRLAALANATVAEEDEARLSLVLLRDVAVVSALLSLFAAAEAWASQSGLRLARGLSVVDGLLVGAGVAAILHEWGRFVGARLAGGHAPLKPVSTFVPIFDFDYANNDARAFDWMSLGGNVGDISAVLLFFLALPHESVGAAALVSGAFGFAVFAGAIEFPVIRKARAGMSGIEALATIPRDFVQRYLRWGLAAALAAFLIL